MKHNGDQFFLLAESAPDAIYVSHRGNFGYLNPAAVRLFGADSMDQLQGRPVIDRIHPDYHPQVLQRIDRLHDHGEHSPLLEEVFLRVDGTPINVEVCAVPFTGTKDAALVFVRDITERSRIDQALRRERKFLRHVIDSSPNLIFVKDRSGRFLLANKAVADAYGTTVAEVEGRTDTDHNSNPQEAANFQRADREVIDCRQPKLIEETVSFADGSVHWYSTSKTPLLEPDGSCDTVLGIATDISELKHTQAELLRHQGLLQSITDNTTAVIFVKDLAGRYLLINQRYSELFHVSNEDMLGRTDADLFGPELGQALRVADLQVLDADTPQEFEEAIPQDDGAHTYLTLKFPLRDTTGHTYAVCGIATDITERQRHQEEVARLNRSLEQRVAERTEELRLKEEQLREAMLLNQSILMTSPAGIAVYRQDGGCVMVNPAFARTIGGSEDQLKAQNFLQLQSWQASGLLGAALEALDTGLNVEHETQLTTTFGRKLWLHCQLSRFISGSRPHLLLVLHDISEQRQAQAALAARERNFRTLADNVPDNIARWDRTGHLLYINKALEVTFNCNAADVVGKLPQEAWPDGRFSDLEQAVRRVAASGEEEEFEQIVPGPDGRPHYHSVRIVAERSSSSEPVSVLAVGRDLTKQKAIEDELRLAASVFHNSAEGVLVTDARGIIVSVNPAFTEITGYCSAEALGQRPSMLRSDRHDPEFYGALWQSLNKDGRWQGEIWNRRKGGEAFLEWLTINRIDDDNGNPVRYVAVFHDITELRRKDERIRHLAFHDALTELPNRALMQDRLQHALERAQRENSRLSVAFIDLDRFKAINDGLGHDVGDLLLQEVAQRIRGRLRAMDTVARLGGDEFVILTEDLTEAGDSANLAIELIAEIARPMELRGHSVEIGASIGIAFFPEDGSDPLELMKRADMAMYAAKSAGRNTYRFFQQDMLDRTSQRLTMEMDLRRAIVNRHLQLHYQPRVALATGQPLGVEALVRWHHPQKGLMPPGDFIPLAEESNLIIELGAWVLEEACRQAAEWKAAGHDFKIAVNVSAKQLEAGDLVERIEALTTAHGIEPRCIEIELTESAVMADPEKVAGLLAWLRALGVTVAVDDFGTGYSSLAYLRRLPIDVLKIDRSFVMDADLNEEDAQIVKTILALGQALKLTVVAEGIETPGQAQLLQSLGCDMAQGYLFCRPLPAPDLLEWIEGFAAKTAGIRCNLSHG